MIIEDGSGNGFKAKVDSDKRVQTKSVVVQTLTDAILEGWGFSWVFTGYNYDAADTVFFLRNDDKDKLLIVDAIELYCDTATKVQVHIPANPTAAGTAITGTNLNRSSNRAPEATAKQDETGNTQGTIIKNTYIAANGLLNLLRENECVVLQQNQCIGVDLVTVGTMAYGQIIGHYVSIE